MNKFTVNLTSDFENELDVIYFKLLFANHSTMSAKQFFYKVRKSVLELNEFSERYSRLSNYGKARELNIRRLLIENYIIIYRVDNERQQVFILHIFHSSQNYLDKL